LVLHLPHLPFQAVYTRVAGVTGQSAADHADNGQSGKAEPELMHIELLMMRRLGLLKVRRRVGSRAIALNRLRTLPGNVFGGLSRAHSIIESTRSPHAETCSHQALFRHDRR
jgi:hypothetical protein